MTYVEQLKERRPELGPAEIITHIYSQCPITPYGNTPPCVYVDGCRDCHACWDQEIPGTEPTNKTENNEREETRMEENNTKISAGMRKTKAQLLEEIDALQREVKELEKYKQYEAAANDLYAMMESFMKAGFTRGEAFAMTGKLVDMAPQMSRR